MNASEELASIHAQLNDDERAVLALAILPLARRLLSGRTRYAPLDIATDTRDFLKEAMEETVDNALYLAMEQLRRERGGED